MNHLVMQGYLTIAGEYRTIQLTDTSDEILNGRPVFMKTARERPKPAAGTKEKKISVSAGQQDIDRGLFEKLRALRLEIARQEKVPPYIVFSDKTLVQMCILKPQDRTEMLRVSGVGEMKYAKYGERFLEVLRK